MYIDDGVSRNSAPTNLFIAAAKELDGTRENVRAFQDAFGDKEAESCFHRVFIEQASKRIIKAGSNWSDVRTVKITTLHNGYDDILTKRDIGPHYTVVFWHAPGIGLENVQVSISGTDGGDSRTDSTMRATIVTVPVDAHNTLKIEVSYLI
ncbi:hypothetical protein MMC25_006127 [Agyrium rufum]|nr:hypothetical protein [Agyrium rufum]